MSKKGKKDEGQQQKPPQEDSAIDKIQQLEKELAALRTQTNKKITGPYVMTAVMSVSEKLQKAGIGVVHVTGGNGIADSKKHYFKTTLKDVKELKTKKGVSILDADDLEAVSEVKDITPTKFIETGLKDMVTSEGPDKPGV